MRRSNGKVQKADRLKAGLSNGQKELHVLPAMPFWSTQRRDRAGNIY